MSSSIQYNPNPPRVWSRVQNICSTIAYTNDDPSANSNFAKAEYDRQMMLKGNVLQYKKNSSNLTKHLRNNSCKAKKIQDEEKENIFKLLLAKDEEMKKRWRK